MNPNIALQYRGFQMESPMNQLAQLMQLQGAQRQNALAALQMKEYERKAAEAEQQRNMLRQFTDSLPSPQMIASQDALAGGGGPSMANAQKMRPVDPRLQMLHGAMKAGVVSPVDYLGAAYPEPPKPTNQVVGKTLVRVQGDKATPLYTDPTENKPTSAIQDYEYAVKQGYKGTFEQWDRDSKKAGASNVSVNTGQKGFDNTLKLRGDFRSEPIYKAHQEMTSAYAQIQQSLKQATPAGDLAGATKIMKLLDPGSVVRESELGMAMQASGLMDRVQNYANLVITGQKLTPQQRKDFQALADALYSESVKQYNGKRTEYQGIAQRNGLNEADVLGSPSAPPTQPRAVKRTGTLNGRKVVEYTDGTIEYAGN